MNTRSNATRNAKACLRLAALCGLLSALPAFADEPGKPAESTDDALFRELTGDLGSEKNDSDRAAPSAADEKAGKSNDATPDSRLKTTGPAIDPGAVERILAGLRGAEQGLARGQTDEPIQSAQQTAISELDRLIEAARSQRSRPKPEPQQKGGQPQPQPAGTSAGEPSRSEGPAAAGPEGETGSQLAPGQSDRADESSDQFRTGNVPTQAIRNFRYELIRDAWGHLPPRLRDQLLGTGGDRYLPQYDSLVRRYFESLAEPVEGDDSGRRK